MLGSTTYKTTRGQLGGGMESLEARRLLAGDSLELVRYESAAELEQTLMSDALQEWDGLFGQQAWIWGREWFGPDVLFGLDPCPVCDVAAAPEAGAPDHSDTNTQVAGVDEADIVENDGNFLYMLSGQELIIADAWQPEELAVVSRLEISGQPVGQFLNGDRLTVISSEYNYYYFDQFWGRPFFEGDAGFAYEPYQPPTTNITLIDVSDRSHPDVISTTEVEGTYTSSRAIGDQVYLITSSEFGLPAPEIVCAEGETSNCVYESRESYVDHVKDNVLELALPGFSTTDDFGTETASGLLSEATDVFKPTMQYAPNLISVSVFDTSVSSPVDLPSVSIPTTYSSSVYGSIDSLYLTNPDWGSGWGNDEATSILKFDIVDDGSRVDLTASGQVPGRLLNSFSMDEYQHPNGSEYFHVATTRGWGGETDNRVFVMQQSGDQLEVVGKTGALARGEQIFSVRYNGPTAYVVTFVQTDPLFTIDLSEPTNPQVKGELHVTGFSNYLQQVHENFLIGLGREADPNTGRAQELQISLFDVSDISDPGLADRYTFKVPDWAWSEAISDHHAVSYFPEQQVLAIPVSNGGGWVSIDRDGDGIADVETYRPRTELYVFQLSFPDETTDKAGIHFLGTVEHDADIRRSVRIEDFLYSISDETVSVHKLFQPKEEISKIHFGRQDVGVTVFEAGVAAPENSAPQVVGIRVSGSQWDYGLVNFLDFQDKSESEKLDVLPFTDANQIKVQFSKDVAVGLNDLRVTGTNQYSVNQFTYDLETYTAIWTLSEPMRAGNVSIRVSGVRDMASNRLDGNANGVAGGSFRYQFGVLPGDVDRDGRVDRADLASAMARSNTVAGSAGYLLSHDVDGNGRIDFADFDAIFKQDQSVLPGYTPRIAGDANGDGVFDSSDLVQVMQRNLYRSGKFASFADGDWNRDGLFDESDFVFAFQQGTYEANRPLAARLATDVAFAEDSFAVDDRLNVRGVESVN